MAMERAQAIIDNLVVKAPFDGVVSVKENRDAAGLLLLRHGAAAVPRGGHDLLRPQHRRRRRDRQDGSARQGRPRPIATTCRPASRRDGADRRAARAGPSPRRSARSAAARRAATSSRRARSASSTSRSRSTSSIRSMRAGSSLRRRHRRPGARANALHVPRQAVFEKNGKNFVYLQIGDRFDRRDVQGRQQHREPRRHHRPERRGRDRARRSRRRARKRRSRRAGLSRRRPAPAK